MIVSKAASECLSPLTISASPSRRSPAARQLFESCLVVLERAADRYTVRLERAVVSAAANLLSPSACLGPGQWLDSSRPIDELRNDVLAVLDQSPMVERQHANRRLRRPAAGDCRDPPIQAEVKAFLAFSPQRRHQVSPPLLPPIRLVLRPEAKRRLHPIARVAGDEIGVVESRSRALGPALVLRLDVLNVRRAGFDATHGVGAEPALLLEQGREHRLLLGRRHLAPVCLVGTGIGPAPPRVDPWACGLLDVLHFASSSRRFIRVSSIGHSARSSPFLLAAAISARAFLKALRWIPASTARRASIASAGRSSASMRFRRIQFESIPRLRSGRMGPLAVSRTTCSGSTPAMISGECVVAMKWQRGNTSGRRCTIVRCHRGWRWRSSSSMSTTARPCLTGSAAWGLACDRRRARSRASASKLRSPSESCRASRVRPSLSTSNR